MPWSFPFHICGNSSSVLPMGLGGLCWKIPIWCQVILSPTFVTRKDELWWSMWIIVGASKESSFMLRKTSSSSSSLSRGEKCFLISCYMDAFQTLPAERMCCFLFCSNTHSEDETDKVSVMSSFKVLGNHLMRDGDRVFKSLLSIVLSLLSTRQPCGFRF